MNTSGLLQCRVCGCGLNRFVHEGMNVISNVKVHLKTSSENVNFVKMNELHHLSSLSYYV